MATQQKQARQLRAYERFSIRTGPTKVTKGNEAKNIPEVTQEQVDAHAAHVARKETELASLKASLRK